MKLTIDYDKAETLPSKHYLYGMVQLTKGGVAIAIVDKDLVSDD